MPKEVTMRLYLVRHGDAVGAVVDPTRPLSERGEKEVRQVAGLLAPMKLEVSEVWQSTKARAQETARILSEALASPVEPVERTGLSPGDPVVPVAEEICALDDDVMLVGHLPFVGRLASLLILGSDGLDCLAFHAGSVACVGRAEDGSWYLEWMVTPEVAGV
jgi:phosphohistidine phosphatase